MTQKPTREQLAAALIQMHNELQQIKYGLAHWGEPLIEAHNRCAFREMRKKK